MKKEDRAERDRAEVLDPTSNRGSQRRPGRSGEGLDSIVAHLRHEQLQADRNDSTQGAPDQNS